MISPVVDSTEAEIWFLMQDLINGQFNAVNRSTGTLPGFDTREEIYFCQPQWLADRDSVTHPGLRLIRGNDYHLAKVLNGIYQVLYTRCCYPVIICYKYYRSLTFCF